MSDRRADSALTRDAQRDFDQKSARVPQMSANAQVRLMEEDLARAMRIYEKLYGAPPPDLAASGAPTAAEEDQG